MKVPLSWLREYVDVSVPVEELARRLTMAGTEVAGVATIGGWQDCYVGCVSKVEPHPNADRLTLCTVDLGGRQLRVVCGAPNVAEQQKVAFAMVGARLFSPRSGEVEPLKAALIRGVVSEGMICSEQELGMGENHAGILVLPPDAPVGAGLSDYLGDHILDLEVTPNRPDCLSLLGTAHEVAALTGATVREPDASYSEEGAPIESMASASIADADLCPRYTASLITGVKVAPSPGWLQDRLLQAGMRPINNVVDITNYVMLEYNQPLHAFDFHTLKGSRIVVRRARSAEMLACLDGVERRLSPDMLVIADAEDAVALGGIIGGAHTEVADGTTAILLESANFNPTNNRRTAQALRIFTEATTRFEKGLRPELAPIALRRATKLIAEIAGGEIARGVMDVFPAGQSYVPPALTLSMERLRKVLGLSLPIERAAEVLTSLGFVCQPLDPGTLHVTVPYWRTDITIEDDLVEEVARIIGYDEVPTTMLPTPIPQYQPQPLRDLRELVKDLLVSCGMQEVISYPVTSLEELQRARALDGGPMPLKLANPLSAQQEYLRTTLRASLLSTLAANRLHQAGPVAIFESGRVYLPRQGDLPEEREVVVGALSGPRGEPHWLLTEGELGFYDAKGVVDALLDRLGIEVTFEPAEDPTLHPGKCARVVAGDAQVGVIGEVHPTVAEAFHVDAHPVALFEFDVEGLHRAAHPEGRRYAPMGRFPAATRDLSLLIDLYVPAGRVRETILRHQLVDQVQLFDVYTGEGIPVGKRSLAFHVYFRSPDRTLTAEEVTGAFEAVIDSLQRELHAEPRT